LSLLELAGLPTADIAKTHDLLTWVLEQEGRIVGVVALERFGAEALLRSLTVAPELRARGFGRELVARAEEGARERNIQRLVLLTETAEAFFRSLGYSILDRQRVSGTLKQSAEFQSLCPVSAICMTKTFADTRSSREGL
jgi:N-acetylglutamate synthase-like GNAT family acetyltransferase